MKEETKQMGLMKKLTSAIVASSLVFSLVGTAAAAYSPTTEQAAGTRMQTLGIINGKPGVGLALNDEITRAELVTTIVRAFGKEQDAALLKGSTTVFPDIANHWASGNIAMAAALVERAGGDAIGMPDGKFNPDGKLTPAQAVAFLMKFIGVKRDASKAWPNDYLDQAVTVGLITSADKDIIAPKLNENATRGLVFYLFDRAFYSYDLGGGKTFYTKYVDTQGPELTVNPIDATTIDSKVTVTGKVSTDATEVYVGTTKVTVDANGNFSSDFALPEVKADAYSITVTARDTAGNPSTQTLKVTRTTGDVDSITADDINVAAGGTATVKAVVKDAKGNVLANQTVTGTSTIGTFADGVFTAGKTTGTGTLTLTAGGKTKDVAVTVTAGALDHVDLSAASVAPGAKVTLTAKDANGNTLTGVTYTQTSADALVDSTNGTFIASKAGAYTVTATAGGVSKNVTVSVYDTTVASYSVSFGANQIVANNASTTTMTVKAMDKFGNVVANASANSAPITVAGPLQVSTDGGNTFAAFGSTLALTNGTATVTVATSGLAGYGGQTVKVTVGNSTTGYKSATLNLVDQVATAVSISNSATFLASNDSTGSTSSITVKDQDGVTMLNGYYPISVALNSGVPAAISGSVSTVYFQPGSAQSVTVVPNYVGATGTVTLTASATGLTTATKSLTMQLAGPAAKLALAASSSNAASPKSGDGTVQTPDTLTYTVSLTDAAGVPVTNVNPTGVVVSFPGLTSSNNTAVTVAQSSALALAADAAGGYKSAALTFSSGVATFTVKAGAITGPVNFLVKDTASTPLAATAAQTVTFAPNAPTSIAFSINGNTRTSVDVAAGASEFDIVAQLKDAAGNKTSATNATFTLTAGVGSSNVGGVASDVVIADKAGSNAITFDANGAATIHVKAGNFVSAQYTLTASAATYTASNGTTATIGTLPSVLTVNVKNTVAANVSVVLYDYTSYAAHTTDSTQWQPLGTPMASSSNTVHAVATVVDAAGRKINNETLSVVKVNSDGTTAAVSTTITNNGDGTYSFDLAPATAPGVTYKVSTSNTTAAVNSQFTVGVRANTTPGSVVIVGASSAQSITRLTEKAITINLADAFGNTVSTTSATTVGLSFSKTVSGSAVPASVQVRTTSGGLAVAATSGVVNVTIPAGQQSVTVYLVTDEAAGVSFTATANAFTVNSTATFNVQ